MSPDLTKLSFLHILGWNLLYSLCENTSKKGRKKKKKKKKKNLL